MKFVCSQCGKEHEGWPSLGFGTPYNYATLTEEEKNSIAKIDEDTCIISWEDQTDRFVRGYLVQKVIDDCQDLDYGIWVSLSEKSFNDYISNSSDSREAVYFGYICNRIPEYEDTLKIKSRVVVRGRFRPEIIPHDDQMDLEFVKDYYEGINKQEAEKRIENMLKSIK